MRTKITFYSATLLALCVLLMAMPAIAIATTYPLAITDSAGRELTITMEPVKIIVLNSDAAEAVKVLGHVHNIVGVVADIKNKKSYYFPGLKNTPSVGTWKEFDYGKIAELATDDHTLVITYTSKLEPVEKLKGFRNITVVAFDFYKHDTLQEEVTKLGTILNATGAVDKYRGWYQTKEESVKKAVAGLEPVSRNKLANAILSYLEATRLGEPVKHIELNRLSRLAWFYSYGQKPWVFIEGTVTGLEDIATKGPGSADDFACTMAGGKNVAGELSKTYPHLGWEWVVAQNPDVIIKGVYTSGWGWSSIDEPERLRADIKSRPAAESIFAVKDNRIYAFCNEPLYGLDSVVGLTYWVKIIHPELNLNPKEVYTEYLNKFMGISYPEGKIFVYPGV
ncbi:MAG: ABC transporter substrate-binding protein [Halobacteriota archaeon]